MTSKTAFESLCYSSRVSNASLLQLGKELKEIKEQSLYKIEIGEGVDTWHQFLSMPEIGMTVSEANHLIKAYELYQQFPEIMNVSKRSWKLLVGQELNDELIESAKTLSYQDLNERLYDHKTNDEGKKTYTYMVMRRCNETGNMSKVPMIESDEVVEKFTDKFEIYE